MQATTHHAAKYFYVPCFTKDAFFVSDATKLEKCLMRPMFRDEMSRIVLYLVVLTFIRLGDI